MILKLMKILLPFVVSGLLLTYAFYDIELGRFWGALLEVDGWLIILLCIFPVLSMLLRAMRWQLLLAPLKPMGLQTVFAYTFIGFMANNILPAHAGELVKSYFLSKKANISGMATLATVFVERILDTVILIFMLALVVAIVPVSDQLQIFGLFIGALVIAMLTMIILLANKNSRIRKWLINLTGHLPARFSKLAAEKLNLFFIGLSAMRQRRSLILMMVYSLFVWLLMCLNIVVLLKGYPLQYGHDESLWLASMAVIVVVAFAVTAPAMPGYFGVTQWAFWTALAYFSIGKTDAVGVSIIFNVTQYVTITAGGIIYLLKEGLSFSSLLQINKSRSAPSSG